MFHVVMLRSADGGRTTTTKRQKKTTRKRSLQKAEEMGIREPEKEPEPKTAMEKIQNGTRAAGDWVANKASDARKAVLPEEEKAPPSTKDQILETVENREILFCKSGLF